jgi:hypothetical protein
MPVDDRDPRRRVHHGLDPLPNAPLSRGMHYSVSPQFFLPLGVYVFVMPLRVFVTV